MDLPFYLRLENPINVSYDEICLDSHITELSGSKIQIAFSNKDAPSIDKSDWSHTRTTITLTLKTQMQISDETVNNFTMNNCLEIINRVITSYQAITGEISNAGYILPLGTSDIQLYADIRIGKKDFRDRFPGHNQNTFPLEANKVTEFKSYLTNQKKVPLSKLFITNARVSLERGQYSLSILQGATAVELRVAQIVIERLKAAGFSDEAIKPYEKMTLSNKLNIPKTDPRSLETYYDRVNGFMDIYRMVRGGSSWIKLRNNVAHRGHLATKPEALRAFRIVNKFLTIVN